MEAQGCQVQAGGGGEESAGEMDGQRALRMGRWPDTREDASRLSEDDHPFLILGGLHGCLKPGFGGSLSPAKTAYSGLEQGVISKGLSSLENRCCLESLGLPLFSRPIDFSGVSETFYTE